MDKTIVNVEKFTVCFLLVICAFCSCREKRANVSVSLDSFADMVDSAYRLDAERVKENIYRQVMSDTDRETADIHARRHYLDGGGMVWMERGGVSSKADSLLAYIEAVDSIGFSREKFCYSSIANDLKRVRRADFDASADSRNNINKVYARLEYHLTKAFLRYVEGMRFGFMNPCDAFNRIDVRDSDSVHVSYRTLYDVPTMRPDKKFVAAAFDVMSKDEKAVGGFLAASQPENPLYRVFRMRLDERLSGADRRRVLCNLERSRWRHGDYPQMHGKCVVVNIPSLHLVAVDGDQRLVMRIGLGSLETKTPLLTSRVKRMDFNPQWIMPKSIVKKSVRQHAGNRGYFESRDYFIQQRSTGKEVDPAVVTGDMLMSKDYLVIQRGGEGNALGRVIFRFDNNFSIFMHDTSNRSVFTRGDRSVSHGCIRVEKPYELAVFMLSDKDEKTMAKMKYSMTVKYGRHRTEDDDQSDPIDRTLLLRSQKVAPQVPIFITYYTLYPNVEGRLEEYDDIYGFDAVIYNKIKTYF